MEFVNLDWYGNPQWVNPACVQAIWRDDSSEDTVVLVAGAHVVTSNSLDDVRGLLGV